MLTPPDLKIENLHVEFGIYLSFYFYYLDICPSQFNSLINTLKISQFCFR